MASTNISFARMKDWMDQTLEWLHDDGSPKMVQKPYQQLLEMMESSKKENHASEVWDLIYKLERLANRANESQEKGEIFLKCAKTAADLENLKDALHFFQAAHTHYIGYQHQDAIVQWMMGCIHWVLLDNVEGITAWQAAISMFRQRQSAAHVGTSLGKWYDDKLRLLDAALAEAIRTGELPPCNLDTPQPAAQPEPSGSSPHQSTFEGDSLRWVSCQVNETVSAGGFDPSGFDETPLGFLEISEVLIEEEQYEVRSVHQASQRRNSVDFSSQSKYQVSCVSGTSMNAAKPVPIEPDDYVLIRAQKVPNNYDIVVAEIYGPNARSTIKRYKRENGKIRLIPETTDPKNIELDWELEFDELDDGFKIIGVVEAVFKRKPQ